MNRIYDVEYSVYDPETDEPPVHRKGRMESELDMLGMLAEACDKIADINTSLVVLVRSITLVNAKEVYQQDKQDYKGVSNVSNDS